MHKEIKTVVRAQRYQTLNEAIAGATAEEKARGPQKNFAQTASRATLNIRFNARNAEKRDMTDATVKLADTQIVLHYQNRKDDCICI